jgi:RND family efflux transporter MFP subunit
VKFAALSSIALAAMLGVACNSEPEVSAAADAPAVPVLLGQAETVELPQPFESGGVVRARLTATIASRVMAPIAVVHVRPGDRVRRGAPLVTLDARESTANNARAGASLKSAAEATRSAEADSHAAEAQLRLARATYARINALHEKRSATAQELDQAVAALAAAEAQVASAQARAASAMAARDAAQAARDAATVGVSYSVLSAPFDGVVIERNADPGSMAAPGLPLLTLEDPTVFRLEVQVDEARAGTIRVGQDVQYRLDTHGERWTAARVSEIGRVDPSSHSFLVKVDVPGAGATRSGSFGRVLFPGTSRRTTAVPLGAVVRRGQLAIVFTVDAEGRARLRPISTGTTANELVEVLAGLNPNDTVVVSPPPGLVDGTRVVRQ